MRREKEKRGRGERRERGESVRGGGRRIIRVKDPLELCYCCCPLCATHDSAFCPHLFLPYKRVESINSWAVFMFADFLHVSIWFPVFIQLGGGGVLWVSGSYNNRKISQNGWIYTKFREKC